MLDADTFELGTAPEGRGGVKMDEDIKRLVVARLRAVPASIEFSIGEHGNFTRDQLIHEVECESEIGQEAAQLELAFIRSMPKLAERLAR